MHLIKTILVLISVLLFSCYGNKYVKVHLVNQTKDNLRVTLFSTFDYPIKLNKSIRTDSLFINARLFPDDDLSIQILKQDTTNFLSEVKILDTQGGSIISVYDNEKQYYHSSFWIAPQQKILLYRVLDHYLKDSLVSIDGLHVSRMNSNKMELELNSAKEIHNKFHLNRKEREIEVSID